VGQKSINIEVPCSANEHTFNANKKTISPADVFKALDDIEFGFLKEPLEAEFASSFPPVVHIRPLTISH
jgi:hypothetical protein